MEVYLTETIPRKIITLFGGVMFGLFFYTLTPSGDMKHVETLLVFSGIVSGIMSYLFRSDPTWTEYKIFLKSHIIFSKIVRNKKLDKDIQKELFVQHNPHEIISYSSQHKELLMRFFYEWYFIKNISVLIFMIVVTLYLLTKAQL